MNLCTNTKTLQHIITYKDIYIPVNETGTEYDNLHKYYHIIQ